MLNLLFNFFGVLLVCSQLALPGVLYAQTDEEFDRYVGRLGDDTIYFEIPNDLIKVSQDLPVRLIVLGKLDTTILAPCSTDSIKFQIDDASLLGSITITAVPIYGHDSLSALVNADKIKQQGIILYKDTTTLDFLAFQFRSELIKKMAAKDYAWIESNIAYPTEFILKTKIVKVKNKASFRRHQKRIFTQSLFDAIADQTHLSYGRRREYYYIYLSTNESEIAWIWYKPDILLGRINWGIAMIDTAY